MQEWTISLDQATVEQFSAEKHTLVAVDAFMVQPSAAIECASLQKFAKITPQYPGVRAPLPTEVSIAWLENVTPLLDSNFGKAQKGWEVQAWFSLVTTKPGDLIPMQCFPHVDGTDPNQLAMMLYLHNTDHGGTAFFKHRSTGLEALSDETFPRYREALHKDVQSGGLPEPAYVTDGLPYFERVYESRGSFNQAVFYRGNLLHSGVIREGELLSDDPTKGRLTINAFFRPTQ
ncbi:MAG: DUF6445 family protein [Pseudomonadota bacterium]